MKNWENTEINRLALDVLKHLMEEAFHNLIEVTLTPEDNDVKMDIKPTTDNSLNSDYCMIAANIISRVFLIDWSNFDYYKFYNTVIDYAITNITEEPYIRLGQAVFNISESLGYNVSLCRGNDSDCYYDNKNINYFLNTMFDYYLKNEKIKDKRNVLY